MNNNTKDFTARSRSGPEPKSRLSGVLMSFTSKILALVMAISMMLPSVAIQAQAKEAPASRAASDPVSYQAVVDPNESRMVTSPDQIGEILTAKNVSGPSGEGKFTITLSALSSASNTTTQITDPLDVVLVLDTSGSMAFGMDGGRNPRPGKSRLDALKKAVNGFIDQTAEKNLDLSDDKKIQIGLVTYASEAQTQSQLTTDTSELKKAINKLSANGATQADLGMQSAIDVLRNGNRPNRKQVVIFFTDGQPTKNSAFSNSVANSAVEHAHTLKTGGATVYSVGIFDGADPNGDVTSTNANSNRFMQAVSSNYPNATAYSGWNVLGTKASSSYYLTATTAGGLEEVFNSIFSTMDSGTGYPVETGNSPAQDGYVTFTDPLGDWMRVSGNPVLNYNDQTYSLTPAGATGNVTTYAANAQVDGNAVYQKESNNARVNLNTIIVQVVKSAGSTGDQVIVQIPAALLPLDYYNNGVKAPALPISVSYDVELDLAARNALNNTGSDPAFSGWLKTNQQADGTVRFRTNQVSAVEARFTPAAGNGFYYDGSNQKELAPIQKDANPTGTDAYLVKPVWLGSEVKAALGNNGLMTYALTNQLQLSKTVVAPEGVTPDPDQQFAFNITVEGAQGNYPAQGTDITEIAFAGGSAVVNLKANQTITIANLPVGAAYTVTETPVDGYTSSLTNNGSGTIRSDQASVVTATNTYALTPLEVEPAESGLQGIKRLTGRDWVDTDEFKFTITSVTPDAPMPEQTEIAVSGSSAGTGTDRDFAFETITFTKPGTYVYRISERSQEGTLIPGVTNSQGIYEITLNVQDNKNGTLSIASKVIRVVQDIDGTQTSRPADSIIFTNTYDPQSIGFAPYFSKRLEDPSGSLSLDQLKFSFTLTRKTAGAPMPSGANGDTVRVENSGSQIQFGEIPLEAKDAGKTFEYEIREAKPDSPIPGMEYSDEFYTLRVTPKFVSGENGTQVLSFEAVTYDAQNNPVSNLNDAAFTNTYAVNPAVLSGNAAIKGAKTLTGKDMDAGEFTFNLSASNYLAQEVLPQPITAASSEAKDGETSTFQFEDLSFTKTGVYTFQITEQKGDNPGIQYDSSIHRVRVTVTAPANPAQTNQLEASVVYLNEGDTAESGARFTNTYSASPAVLTGVSGRKEFSAPENSGLTANPDAVFTFHLEGPKGTNADLLHKPGSFSIIENQMYSQAGTYTYTLQETPTASGVDSASVGFDSSVYTITVTVKDNEEGQLEAAASFAKDGQPAEEIVFRNTFQPQALGPISLSPAPEKVLEGRDDPALKQDEFSFTYTLESKPENGTGGAEMTAPQGYPAAENGTITVGNNADGTIPAPTLTFTKPGTYTVSLKEDEKTSPGVTNAQQTVQWVYTVTLNANGALQYTVTQPADYIFTNTYKATGTLNGENSLHVKKTIEGREWLDSDAFTFELTAHGQSTQQAVANGDVVLPQALQIEATKNNQNPSFGDITFNKAGTYQFAITEQGTDLPGMTIDSSPKVITVNVTDNGKGELIAAKTADSDDLAFTNTYSATEVSLDTNTQLPITKDYTGKPWTGERFEFNLTLQAGDSNGVRIDNTSLILTADSKTGGFGNLTFSKPGDYTFKVEEVAGDNQSTSGTIQYGSNEADRTKTFVVHVEDNSQGQLVCRVEGNPDLTFHNTFTPDPVTADLNGTLYLEGRNFIPSDTFDFTLAAGPSNPDAAAFDQNAATVENQDENNSAGFAFGSATYTKPGVWTYTVSQTQGNIPGITYDLDPVTVTVTVLQDPATGALSTALAYEKGGQAQADLQFTDRYRADGASLSQISGAKVVNSENGTFKLQGNEFSFTLTPSPNNPAADPVAPVTVRNDGNGDFSFLSGEVKYTQPGTYTYTITEDNTSVPGISYDSAVYLLTVTVSDDAASGKLTLTQTLQRQNGDASEEADKIEFTNTYKPAADTINVPVLHKVLQGQRPGGLQAGEFRFELSIDGPEDGAAAASTTAVNDAYGNIDFGSIEFVKAGTYTLTIREQQPADPDAAGGMIYDSQPVMMTVTVTEADGALTAALSAADKNVFTNTYSPSGVLDGAADLKVTKDFTGRENNDWLPTDQFTFKIQPADILTQQAVDENTVVFEGATAIVASADNKQPNFGSIRFTQPGTYTFDVYEEQGSLPSVTYDTAVRKVIVTVTDPDGNGHLVVTKDTASSDLTFHNIYGRENVQVDTETAFPIQKVLEGKEWGSEGYKFTLTADESYEGAAPLSVDTVLTKEKPEGSFGTLTFTKPGTYNYTIKEGTDASFDGGTMNWDTHEVKVQIVVTDDGAGKLTAGVSHTGELTFINRFESGASQAVLAGTKILNGRSFQETDLFRFTITADESSPANTPMPAQTTVENEEGSISFGEIEYDKPGVYTYKIKEEPGDLPGITYDSRTVTATVTVRQDPQTGALIASTSYDGNGFVFENTYAPQVTEPLSMDAFKTVQSTSSEYQMQGGEFEFRILPDENNPQPDPVDQQIKTNSTDGIVTLLDKVQYSQSGIYRYSVSEISSGQAGMSYDPGVYLITVQVTDEQNGQLTATASIRKGNGEAVDHIEFVNQYNPDRTSATLQVQKELTGKALTAGQFSFILNPAGAISSQQPDLPQQPENPENPGEPVEPEKPALPEGPKEPETPQAPSGLPQPDREQPKQPPQPSQSVSDTNDPALKEPDTEISASDDSTADGSGQTEQPVILDLSDPADQSETQTGSSPSDKANASGEANDSMTYLSQDNKTEEAAVPETVQSDSTDETLETSSPEEQNGENENPDSASGENNALINSDLMDDPANSEPSAPGSSFDDDNLPEIPEEDEGIDDSEAEDDGQNSEQPDQPAEITNPLAYQRIASNDESGLVSFGEIVFEQPGDYFYTIEEVNDGQPGIDYDQTVLNVTVKVRDINGKLAVVAIEGMGEEGKLYTFSNKYQTSSISLTGNDAITAEKVLSGRSLQAGEFSFILVDASGKTVGTGTNTAQGVVVIQPVEGELTYDQAGVHRYTLREVRGNASGITYDPSRYGVTVTITEENGQLSAVHEFTLNGQPIDNAVFTNTYSETSTPDDRPASVALSAAKIFRNGTLNGNDFSFVLMSDGKIVQTKTNNKTGQILFDSLTFTTPGTYVYQISELPGSDSSITYDNSTITVIIEVVRGTNGRLIPLVVTSSAPVFINEKKTSTTPTPNPGTQTPQTPSSTITNNTYNTYNSTTSSTVTSTTTGSGTSNKSSAATAHEAPVIRYITVGALSSASLLLLARHRRKKDLANEK